MSVVAICVGGSCRKRPEQRELCRALRRADDVEVVEVRCLDVCSGPVLVLDAASAEPVVVRKVRSPKARRDVVRVARDHTRPSKRLRERTVTGQQRTRALARAARALNRGH